MDANTEKFIVVVKEYLALIDGAAGYTAHALLRQCAILLPEIYSLGLQLPDVEPKHIGVHRTRLESPMKTLTDLLGDYNRYKEVYDPLCDVDLIEPTLSDDLADIFLDLQSPWEDFQRGNKEDAIWSWRFSIRGHCGDHIVDSLRVIHRLVHDAMPDDYKSSDDRQ
jgi:hypothetical protein